MENTRHSPLRALVSGLIGIIIFLLVLVLFRFIADHTSWALFSGFVDLLSANAPLIIFFSVMFMIGDIFAAFSFPFNLPFPIFSAVGSVLLVTFIIRIIVFIDTFYAIGISPTLELVKLILYPLTIIVVLVAGYLSIAAQFRKEAPGYTGPSPETGQPGRSTVSPTWEEVGDEFRQMFYDLFRRIRDDINRK
ncbi:MAG: hypothetical protein GKC07_03470 [Methanomicrobiales archaeon]|nr:hypothetical protein [Methanomicrobiales archaeon]TRO42577.1 hypothetical protein E2P30_03375 [Candidatus Bathyarchaeota archaeon]